MTEEYTSASSPTEAPRRTIRDHQDAEAFVAEWMHWAGYRGAEPTQATADGGIDVMSGECVAQVKFGTRATGRPAVQGLYGAATGVGRQGLFFSAGGFTRQAEQWAEQVGIALFTLSADGEVVASNGQALRIVRTAKGLPPRHDPTLWIVGLVLLAVLGAALWGASLAGWFGFVFVGIIAAGFMLFFLWIAKEMFGTAIMAKELLRRRPNK